MRTQVVMLPWGYPYVMLLDGQRYVGGVGLNRATAGYAVMTVYVVAGDRPAAIVGGGI